MIRVLFGSVFAVIMAAAIIAQEPMKRPATFADIFAKYEAGEDVTAEFKAIAADEKADAKDRFNAAYISGVIALEKADADLALKCLDQAEKIRAKEPQVAIRRAEALSMKKSFKDAQKSLDLAAKALMGKKSALHVRWALAQAGLDLAQGLYERAAERLEAVTKLVKDDWQVYYDLARAYEALDKPKEAVQNYEKVIALDPKKDPFPGLIAYQRAAALSVSSDGSSYGKPELAKAAVQKYRVFLYRAAKNNMPDDLVAQTRQAVDVLENFVLSGKN